MVGGCSGGLLHGLPSGTLSAHRGYLQVERAFPPRCPSKLAAAREYIAKQEDSRFSRSEFRTFSAEF